MYWNMMRTRYERTGIVMDEIKYQKTAMEVSGITIIGNVMLSLLKFVAGFMADSSAMISDAVHSASDVLSTLVVVVGIRMAGKPADKEHPFGHERMECVTAIILAVVLGMTGLGIGFSGIKTALLDQKQILVPGTLALVAAVISIVSKEGMYWYTIIAANRIKSSGLKAAAWHHRSDALSSIGSFVGILGARMGYPICDPLASVIISVFIVKAAVEIFRDAVRGIMDTSCNTEIMKQMKGIILGVSGVLAVDRINTRLFGNRVYVEVEIQVSNQLNVIQSHAISQSCHDAIEVEFPNVKHCMVHVNPAA